MRASLPQNGSATAVVTLPPSPSSFAEALPATGMSHAALIATSDAFQRVADTALSAFTIMTPFLNDEGLSFAVGLFRRTKAARKQLIVRLSDSTRAAIFRASDVLAESGVGVLDYTIPADSGYETFHAKVLLADQDLAYVGSANLTIFPRNSMELGILVDGRTARVVANVVQSVERIAPRWNRPLA